MDRNLFLRLDWFYFLIYLNYLYESYLPLSKLFMVLFFNHLIQNQLSAATATFVTPVVSDNGKLQTLFLRFEYFHFFNYHQVIIWVLLTIIYIISNLIYIWCKIDSLLTLIQPTLKVIFGLYLEYFWGVDS